MLRTKTQIHNQNQFCMFLQAVSHGRPGSTMLESKHISSKPTALLFAYIRWYLPKEYGWVTAYSSLPAIASDHQSCGIITFHFSIWLPFVVPSPERFAVVFCTLLGTEVQTICWTWLMMTKLINTTGTLAEFAAILWPKKTRKKKFFCKTYFLCDWHVTCVLTEKTRGRTVLGDEYLLYGPLICMVSKTKQSSCHELSPQITANSAKMQPSRGESCFH